MEERPKLYSQPFKTFRSLSFPNIPSLVMPRYEKRSYRIDAS
jgi:hypothetical protein